MLEGDHLLSHWLKVGRTLTQSNHPSIIRFSFRENKFSRMFFSINVYSPFISSFLPSIQGFQQISPYFRLDKVGRSDMIRIDKDTETGQMSTLHTFLRRHRGDMNPSDTAVFGESTSNQVCLELALGKYCLILCLRQNIKPAL